MRARQRFSDTMATPWRRRRMCLLVHDRAIPAVLRQISGTGAYLETNDRPPLGSEVELHHPEAGKIEGIVRSVSGGGVQLAFHCSEKSVAFALAAITADMSRPAR